MHCVGFGALAILAACYTTTNVATMAPLQTAYPVSTSSQYIDQGGSIVMDKDYDVVHSFAFHRAVEGRRHESTLTLLGLEPDLDRIMSTTHGDAITAMTVQVTNYDPGSHGPAAGMKLLGWTIGIAGLTVVVVGARVGGDDGTTFAKVGVVTAGLGVVSYIIGTVMNVPASWQLDVKGNVVRRRNTSTRRASATTTSERTP